MRKGEIFLNLYVSYLDYLMLFIHIFNTDFNLWRKDSQNKNVSIALLLETHLGDLRCALQSQHTDYSLTKAMLQGHLGDSVG